MQAAVDADAGMEVPIGLMSFSSSDPGRPTTQQPTLYIAAIAFTYAVWENYIEDLAIELAEVITEHIPPRLVPPSVQKIIADKATAWELSVHPGWRGLWLNEVIRRAKGEDGVASFGLNTASWENVGKLFALVGIAPIPERIAAPKSYNNDGVKLAVPKNISVSRKDGTVVTANLLSQLITVRSQAVHTAKTTVPLAKPEVLWWAEIIRTLYEVTDNRGRRAARALIQGVPITDEIMDEPDDSGDG